MLFSAVHQLAKPSLLLWGARAVGMVGCPCTLRCGDTRHEHVQLSSGGLTIIIMGSWENELLQVWTGPCVVDVILFLVSLLLAEMMDGWMSTPRLAGLMEVVFWVQSKDGAFLGAATTRR